MVVDDRHMPSADELRGICHGSVVTADDPEYEEARTVWNGMIDRRPLAIIRAADLDDIRAGIRLARERGLPLAIRGGGHNVAGNATVDDGIVLDLGGLNAIEVDAEARTVRAGPGATLGDLDLARGPSAWRSPSVWSRRPASPDSPSVAGSAGWCVPAA
jgi:FAD/FMN-containing dehydrogenase